ncbi:MAG: NAD(P)-dependent alcohol dehydrogenase [Bacillota bacterium]|nr:NAD(P)-dependent alcohol dehydrogenase [Bacillota bacterium]
MEGKMKVAVMTGIGQMAFVEKAIPQPQADEVLVKIEAVGICGSDLHYYEQGRIGGFVVEPPFVLGHESAGVVVEAGADVTHLKVGDRVALEPGKTCGQCEFCKSGRYNLCPDVIFFATPPVDGVFQEYITHEAALCFKLPDSVDAVSGALIEPLAVGFHAVRQGDARIGQSAIIFGAGCIGLVTLLALRAIGIYDVTVVDVLDNRLEKARSIGASHTIQARGADVTAEGRKITGGRGYDLAFETAGLELTTRQSMEMVKKGGVIVLIGYSASGEMNLPVSMALDKELTLKTIFRYRHVYPLAIQAVADGLINLGSIVTNTFDFAEVARAMDESAHNKAQIVKAVIRF